MPIALEPFQLTPVAHVETQAPFAFRKAVLGMDLAAWRVTDPARGAAACEPAPAAARVVRCKVASQPLANGYRLRDIVHTFVDGRLAQIRFSASIDGFSWMVAELKRAYGVPSEIRRGEVRLADGRAEPQVVLAWRNAASAIELRDPSATGLDLDVRLALNTVPASLAS